MSKSSKCAANLLVKIQMNENKTLCEVLNTIFMDDINKNANISSELLYDRIFEYGFKKNII
ncbi:MAG: hypothetical protein RBR68_11280 [Tenuifilaceae bacterium]|nr:hypothetical protein [Tenuifilaceae bacterium]